MICFGWITRGDGFYLVDKWILDMMISICLVAWGDGIYLID
jgi:hypothetical protein